MKPKIQQRKQELEKDIKEIKRLRKKNIKRETNIKEYAKLINLLPLESKEAQLQTISFCEKEFLKMMEKEELESKKLIKEISHHRCRAKTGNWCLDCERLNSEATGIFNTCENLKNNLGK